MIRRYTWTKCTILRRRAACSRTLIGQFKDCYKWRKGKVRDCPFPEDERAFMNGFRSTIY